MIKATPEQISLTNNPFQTNTSRVLSVCSIGMLRSPTIANVLHQILGFNTRSCGVDKQRALIPITEALLTWADLIVFADMEVFNKLLGEDEMQIVRTKEVKVLDLPDVFEWNELSLQKFIIEQFDSIPNMVFDSVPDIGI